MLGVTGGNGFTKDEVLGLSDLEEECLDLVLFRRLCRDLSFDPDIGIIDSLELFMAEITDPPSIVCWIWPDDVSEDLPKKVINNQIINNIARRPNIIIQKK